MQLGFVIDHSRCIGCHACTVACKSENHVPVGSFRTWVKYTEAGTFPDVRRSFAVLRCNQCSAAPCVTICPVSALEKRPDGIVDVDPRACIGCKACMHGCPYDALYISPDTGTAEKCHFCAHRTERGLAPACAVVCPTEAIVPGDFDDPTSRVSRLRAEHGLTARKTEAGTGPNVYYREASPHALDPGATNLAQGAIWTQRPSGPMVDAQSFEAMERRARGQEAPGRTVYDVPRRMLWGDKITGYLFAKSLAAGLFFAGAEALRAAVRAGDEVAVPGVLAPVLALAFLALTGLLLVADLKRPDRFYMILLRPNWSSWLARGTFIIVLYSLLLVAWIGMGLAGLQLEGRTLTLATGLTEVAALATAAYTAWLFAQAKGRALWMKRGYWIQLVAQALLAGAAALLPLQLLLGWPGAAAQSLRVLLAGALAIQLLAILLETKLAPSGREAEYHRAARLVTHGPYARLHWAVGVGLGTVLPLLLLWPHTELAWSAAGVLALVGLWVEEKVFVEAGQALPIS